MIDTCNRHPKYQGIGKFPKSNCGDCKNIWMDVNSNPGDLRPLFFSDGTPMGHSIKPVISKNVKVGCSIEEFGRYYNSEPTAWPGSSKIVKLFGKTKS